MKMSTFFQLALPFGSKRSFPADKIRTIYLDLQIQKVFVPEKYTI